MLNYQRVGPSHEVSPRSWTVHAGFTWGSTCPHAPAERMCPLQWVQLDPLKWCYGKIHIENGKCPMPGLIDFGCQRVVGNMMFAMIPVGAKMIKMSCSCCRQGWHVWHGSLPFLSVPAYHACHISRAPNKNVFAQKKCYIALAIFVGQVRVKVTYSCL